MHGGWWAALLNLLGMGGGPAAPTTGGLVCGTVSCAASVAGTVSCAASVSGTVSVEEC